MDKQNIPDTMDEIKGFILNHNYKLITAHDKYCEMEAEVTETSLNPYGTAHGGFIFGLADTAAGIACKTTGRLAMTINATIDYLHMVKGNKIKAVANCLKDGKTITVYEVLIYDEVNELVAKSNITFFYVN